MKKLEFATKALNPVQRKATRSVVMNFARPFKAGMKAAPQTRVALATVEYIHSIANAT